MIINGVDCGWFGEKCAGGTPPLSKDKIPTDTRFQTSNGRLITKSSAGTGSGAKAPAKSSVNTTTRAPSQPSAPRNNGLCIKQVAQKMGLPEWAIPAGIVVLFIGIIFIIR